MRLPKYQLKSGERLSSYEFISEGPKGLIKKRIQFTLINKEEIYNLGFGDVDEQTNEFYDLVVSNNGDSEKVLATVISAVYAFCDMHPNAWVFATGSTASRNRLYQIGISKYIHEIKEDFDVYGQTEIDWEEFQLGRNYLGFLVQRKNKIS